MTGTQGSENIQYFGIFYDKVNFTGAGFPEYKRM